MLNIGLGRICNVSDKNPKAGFLSTLPRLRRPAELDYPGFAARLKADI